ncbi:MAG: hypothetical protein B6242_09730 [Anaerolineaceae bacterium 4572_78]|nr:MAG: hypothetical protein B6242_09730 [Anaerolineaceae bacterium 4572_78]
MPDLAIIIVNYNTCDLLRDCLQSIRDSQYHPYTIETCVVDNNSTDDSVKIVRQEFPEVHVIINQENYGFAQANNQGLRHFGFEYGGKDLPCYAMLLNPDTKLMQHSLATMLNFMDTTPQAGVTGPKLILPDGSLDLACRRSFPTPTVSFYRLMGLAKLFPKHPTFAQYNMTHVDPDMLIEVDSVVGACMMVRGKTIEETGLLDERYFMYGEDLDWAFRIKQNGWHVFYNPLATVFHVKRAASRHSRKAKLEFYRRNHYANTTPWWLHYFVLSGIYLKWGLTYLVS